MNKIINTSTIFNEQELNIKMFQLYNITALVIDLFNGTHKYIHKDIINNDLLLYFNNNITLFCDEFNDIIKNKLFKLQFNINDNTYTLVWIYNITKYKQTEFLFKFYLDKNVIIKSLDILINLNEQYLNIDVSIINSIIDEKILNIFIYDGIYTYNNKTNIYEVMLFFNDMTKEYNYYINELNDMIKNKLFIVSFKDDTYELQFTKNNNNILFKCLLDENNNSNINNFICLNKIISKMNNHINYLSKQLNTYKNIIITQNNSLSQINDNNALAQINLNNTLKQLNENNISTLKQLNENNISTYNKLSILLLQQEQRIIDLSNKIIQLEQHNHKINNLIANLKNI